MAMAMVAEVPVETALAAATMDQVGTDQAARKDRAVRRDQAARPDQAAWVATWEAAGGKAQVVKATWAGP